MKSPILKELLSLREALTKSKNKTFIDQDILGTEKEQPLTKTSPENDYEVPSQDKKISGVEKQKTYAAMSNMSLDDKSIKHLTDLHKNLRFSDQEEVEPKPPVMDLAKIKPADVPAVLQKAMVSAGFIDPDFHLVSNLPGNMSKAIEMLGKQLFKSLTKTPTSKITVVANMGNMGPNTGAEVNAVAQFARLGKDLGDGNIDFDSIMPGYSAQTHTFSNAGVRFLLVKDHMGNYIYSWPEDTSLTHTTVKQIN